MPVKIFWWPDDSLEKFDGHGSWKLVQGQSHWELHLHFEKTTARDLSRFNTSVMLAREGDFETGKERYIFLWVGEEGGDKYKFEMN